MAKLVHNNEIKIFVEIVFFAYNSFYQNIMHLVKLDQSISPPLLTTASSLDPSQGKKVQRK